MEMIAIDFEWWLWANYKGRFKVMFEEAVPLEDALNAMVEKLTEYSGKKNNPLIRSKLDKDGFPPEGKIYFEDGSQLTIRPDHRIRKSSEPVEILSVIGECDYYPFEFVPLYLALGGNIDDGIKTSPPTDCYKSIAELLR